MLKIQLSILCSVQPRASLKIYFGEAHKYLSLFNSKPSQEKKQVNSLGNIPMIWRNGQHQACKALRILSKHLPPMEKEMALWICNEAKCLLPPVDPFDWPDCHRESVSWARGAKSAPLQPQLIQTPGQDCVRHGFESDLNWAKQGTDCSETRGPKVVMNCKESVSSEAYPLILYCLHWLSWNQHPDSQPDLIWGTAE